MKMFKWIKSLFCKEETTAKPVEKEMTPVTPTVAEATDEVKKPRKKKAKKDCMIDKKEA